MPLIKSPKKSTLNKNIRTEMGANPDKRKQDLAIAFSVQRQAKKKKMAEGGSVSAANEKRPMPNDTHDDGKMTSQNRHMRSNGKDGWTDTPTETQAKANDVRGKKLPIKRPRMVPTNAFSTRLYDEEGQLQESASPGPYDAQPPKHDDEDGANRQGPKVSDMEDEHSTGRKPYAKGGEVEASDYDSPESKYEDDLTDLPPSEDEAAAMARSHNELDADKEDGDPDMAEPHNEDQTAAYADGGEVEEEHHASITAAIMARRDRLHAEIDSGAHDLDEAVRMAEGGEIMEEAGDILSHGSMDSDDSDQADLSRNHDEDANEEDQASWNALRKENYNDSNLDVENPRDSAQMGDEEEADSENKHDMISSIRSKMRSRRQF